MKFKSLLLWQLGDRYTLINYESGVPFITENMSACMMRAEATFQIWKRAECSPLYITEGTFMAVYKFRTIVTGHTWKFFDAWEKADQGEKNKQAKHF